MHISSISYHLFESDAEHLNQNRALPFHEIEREIQITSPESSVYISWAMANNAYRIEHQAHSFFSNHPAVTQDHSTHPIWAQLVGTKIDYLRAGPDGLALEIRGTHHSVYCSPFEQGRWGVDVLHISTTLPSAAA